MGPTSSATAIDNVIHLFIYSFIHWHSIHVTYKSCVMCVFHDCAARIFLLSNEPMGVIHGVEQKLSCIDGRMHVCAASVYSVAAPCIRFRLFCVKMRLPLASVSSSSLPRGVTSLTVKNHVFSIRSFRFVYPDYSSLLFDSNK